MLYQKIDKYENSFTETLHFQNSAQKYSYSIQLGIFLHHGLIFSHLETIKSGVDRWAAVTGLP